MENTFPHRLELCDEELYKLYNQATLVYTDEDLYFFRTDDGRFFVLGQETMEKFFNWDLETGVGLRERLDPVEQVSLRAVHLESIDEALSKQQEIHEAVLLAGFATEPLRHCLQELYECLYVRMLNDPLKGFTDKEWEACREAKRLLGIS